MANGFRPHRSDNPQQKAPVTKTLYFLTPYVIAFVLISRIHAEPTTQVPQSTPDAPVVVPQGAAAPATAAGEPAPVPPKPPAAPTKPCFQCKGVGKTTCPYCVKGLMDCPAPCLKASTPGWQHLNVPGHKPEELWMKYPDDTGSGYQAWSQDHIGQVVKRKDGRATIVETCPMCKGKAKLTCGTCNGASQMICNICTGTGVVPESWTAFDNPKLKTRPVHFKLRDGTEVIGRKVVESTNSITVRTEKGTVDIKKADLAP